MKFTYEQLKNILSLAVQAGNEAGMARLATLRGQGPAYSIHPADLSGRITGPSQGTMLDLCGFAYCSIPSRVLSTRSKAVKQLVAEGLVRTNTYERCLTVRLPYIDQAISVNEAQADAAARVLTANGITAYMSSRLD